MSALADYFQVYTAAYSTEWFRFPDGTVTSYRFHRDTYQQKRKAVEDKGGVKIADPFRKGAPTGGFQSRQA